MGEKVPDFTESSPDKTLSDDQGKGFESGGAVPQTPFPESGGGSRQKSHGDPRCGTRETRERVQVIKKNVNRGLQCVWLSFQSLDSQFEILGKKRASWRCFQPAGMMVLKAGAPFAVCSVRVAGLIMARQPPWFEWLFC